MGVVSEVIPGSSSLSGVPAAEIAAAAAAAAAAVPAVQVFADLKKHIDGVVRNIAILSDSYARDRTKTNAQTKVTIMAGTATNRFAVEVRGHARPKDYNQNRP